MRFINMSFRFFSNNISKGINEFALEVLGAGGAVWAAMYAIPNAAMKYFCGEQENCSNYNEDAHMFTVMTLALLATGNAAYQKYVATKDSEESQPLIIQK